MTTKYSSYLLRVWLISKEPPEVRVQLEDSATKAQYGFSSFDSLSDFLKKEIQKPDKRE